MSLALAAVLAFSPLSALSDGTPPQEGDLYRVLNVRAAPGELLALMELHRDWMGLVESLGEEPVYSMRHSQGDQWDLMLIQAVGSFAEYYSADRVQRLLGATSPAGRSAAELVEAIDDATAWREEMFATGPAASVVRDRFDGAGLFHVEMFIALPGKRDALLEEREMENRYLAELGREENLIFVRAGGAAWDSFTIGFYRDLKHYAESGDRPAEDQQAAALVAGFEGADRIGTYLRELIASHHDTLAVPAG